MQISKTITKYNSYFRKQCFRCDFIRVRVRERLSATPGHVIGQGPAPGGGVVTCCGSGGGSGECTFLRVYGQIGRASCRERV